MIMKVACDAAPCYNMEICFPIRYYINNEGERKLNFQPVVAAWTVFMTLIDAYREVVRCYHPLDLYACANDAVHVPDTIMVHQFAAGQYFSLTSTLPNPFPPSVYVCTQGKYPVNLFGQVRFVGGSPYGKHALLCPSVKVKDKTDLWCFMEPLCIQGVSINFRAGIRRRGKRQFLSRSLTEHPLPSLPFCSPHLHRSNCNRQMPYVSISDADTGLD